MAPIKTPDEIALALKLLAAPTPPDEIRKREGPKGKMLDYIDARFVMERLDEVVGPENWQRLQQVVPGGAICGVSILLGDTWVEKWDGGDPSDIEGFKGALSDSFKRAAVNWGIARDLYDDRAHAPAPAARSQATAAPRRAAAPAPARSTDLDGNNVALCPVHGLAWEHKTGTSQSTNKPYDFWSCPAKDGSVWCKARPDDDWVHEMKEAASRAVARPRTPEDDDDIPF